MDVFRFIGWWWDQRDGPERILFIFLFWLVTTLPWMFFIGLTAILIFFGGLAFSGVLYILFRAYQSIRSEWKRYKIEREVEAQNIVNKLAGKPKTSAEEILEKLRSSHNRFKSI